MTALPETAAVEADPTMQWLGDAPARSVGALARLRGTPPAPPTSTPPVDPSPPIDPGPRETPDPPSSLPVVGASFYHPVSEAECKATMQNMLDQGKLLQFDPTTRLNISDTFLLHLSDVGGAPHGFRFNGAQFSWTGNDPTKQMLNFDLAGPQNRGLVIDDGYFYGGGYQGLLVGSAIKLTTSGGGAIYLAKLRGDTMEFAGLGIEVAGNIFEFLIEQPTVNACHDAGLRFAHQGGVLSNAIVQMPFIRAVTGPAIDLVENCNSVMVDGGSLISCNGGIVAPTGIKFVGGGIDMENCGKQDHPDRAAITVGPTMFGTMIDGVSCENTAGQSPGADWQPAKIVKAKLGPVPPSVIGRVG
jgi:hypothetical protein